MIPSSFIAKLKVLKIDYTDEMLEKLNIYCNFLMEYNEHTNLTAIREKEDIYLKHFYDSLTICKAIELNTVSSLLDIGSGAGFPGVVLKIFFPHLKVTLLDSNNKKTTFLSLLIEKLDLDNIEVVNQRAEDYAKLNKKYDLVTARAVAYIDIITTLSSYFVNDTGLVLLMKGNINEEIHILDKYKNELNISKYQIINCNISDNDERNIIKIAINSTNKILNYPQILKRHEKWTRK